MLMSGLIMSDDELGVYASSTWQVPADRFLASQMWWTASELVRRHSYMQISMFEHKSRGRLLLVHGERAGVSIEFDLQHGIKCVVQGEVFWITWCDVFAAKEESEIVERIEDAMRVVSPTLSPQTTPRVLAYRVIASALTTAVDDEHGWDAVPAPIAIGGDPTNPACDFFRGFPSTAPSIAAYAKHAIDTVDPVTGSVFHQPFWALLRGSQPVAIVDTAGDIHTVMGKMPLVELYEHINRNLSLTTASVLGPYLP